jgi:hypothetical protein
LRSAEGNAAVVVYDLVQLQVHFLELESILPHQFLLLY